MATNQESYPSGHIGLPRDVVAIVQHDTNLLSETIRGIYCNAAGDVRVKYHGMGGSDTGGTATHTVVAGQVLWGLIVQVLDTGTTLADAQMIGYL